MEDRRTRRDEHLILEARADNVCIGADQAVIADAQWMTCARPQHRVLHDDAVAADARRTANVDVVADRGALAELDSGLDEGRLVNPRPTGIGRIT